MKPIAVEELTKVFADGTEALGGITFEVEAGEVFGLLGPNGSGKTTAVRIMVTLLRHSSGSVRIAGYDVVRDARRVRQVIGYAAQYAGVDDDLTVVENLILSGGLHGMTAADARHEGDALIEILGLSGAADKRVGRLSGGMRRRLDLARAMVHRPRVLFLDEPTTGLDPQARNALWQYLRSRSDEGTTILLTTQYLEEADVLCHRVAILDQGRIVTMGAPRDLKESVGEDRITVTLEHPDDAGDIELARLVASTTPGVLNIAEQGGELTLQLVSSASTLPELIRRLDAEAVTFERLQLTPTTLDDVFLVYTGRAPRREAISGRRPSSVFAALHGRR